MSLQALRLFHS